MTHRRSDKLARRLRQQDDRHRREMIALKREVIELVFTLTRPPDIEIMTMQQLRDRLTGRTQPQPRPDA